MPEREEPKLGDRGQCEAEDLIPTEDDCVRVRCQNEGRRISERCRTFGWTRWRIVCPFHGLTSALEVN